MLIIDRIEDGIATIEYGSGAGVFNMPASLLPGTAAEGDVLLVCIDQESGSVPEHFPESELPKGASRQTPLAFCVDREETARRPASVSSLMDDLFV